MAQPTMEELKGDNEKQDSSQKPKKDGVAQSFKDSMIFRILKTTAAVVLVLVGLYLILMPFLPTVMFYAGKTWSELGYGPFAESSGGGTGADDQSGEDDNIPEENTLRIATIGVDVEIVEGATDAALSRGAWHRPGTGDPVNGGNMVLTGHRFRYLPPSNLTFYHLDKVEENDSIVVYWEGTRYDYSVTEIFVVEPNQVEVEANTAEHRLTLYTCTPLWTANQRLVVVAKPDGWGDLPDEGQTVDLEAIEE